MFYFRVRKRKNFGFKGSISILWLVQLYVVTNGGSKSANCFHILGKRRHAILREEPRGTRCNRFGSCADRHGQISISRKKTSGLRHRRCRYKVRVSYRIDKDYWFFYFAPNWKNSIFCTRFYIFCCICIFDLIFKIFPFLYKSKIHNENFIHLIAIAETLRFLKPLMVFFNYRYFIPIVRFLKRVDSRISAQSFYVGNNKFFKSWQIHKVRKTIKGSQENDRKLHMSFFFLLSL